MDSESPLRGIRLEGGSTAKNWMFCFPCGELINIPDDEDWIVAALVTQTGKTCPSCGKGVSPWHSILQGLKEKVPHVFLPIGLKLTWSTYRLPIGITQEVDLSTHGVPADAKVLRVRHAAGREGGVIVDLDANDSARALGTKYRMLGLWTGEGAPPADLQGSTMIHWANPDADDSARLQLMIALCEYMNGDLRACVLPANVAIEEPLARICSRYDEAKAARTKGMRAHTRQKRHSFSHQLNDLLPGIVAVESIGLIPPLKPGLRCRLNRLKDLRNQVAHGGASLQLDRDEVAECLTAAIYGFTYMRLIEGLLKHQRDSQPGA